MNANEFRIGNLITYLNEIYIVDGIKYEEKAPSEKYRISFKTIDGKLFNAKMENWIEPIPITEEWLLKFGFECIDEVNRGFTKVINDSLREKLYCNPSGSCAIISELINYQDFLFMDAKINTVHKLQNLYFALTCEELVAE